MRGVRGNGRGGVEVRAVDEPDAGDGRVLVRVASVGICGSDLTMVATGFATPELTLGHELAGRLDDGTAVAVEPLLRCGSCDQCSNGAYHRCRSQQVLGATTGGGMADLVAVPPECLVPLPSGVAVADACLVEPLAVAVHGIRLAGVVPGMRVAVVGAGSIGLAAVAAARAGGASVGLVARHRSQAEAGERLGAFAVAAAGDAGEFDVVVEAAGTPSALDRAVALAAPGAVVSLLGSSWGPMTVDGVSVQMKELRLMPSYTYGRAADGERDIDTAASLLAGSPEVAEVLVSHRFPLDEAAHAFAVAADRSAGAVKVVLEP